MPLYHLIPLMVLGGLVALALLLSLLYLLFLIRPRRKKDADPSLFCDYAHRGRHGDGVPENSLAAFRRACEAGYGIELDVQLSRDGQVMVFHDYTLGRMTGDARSLSDCTSEALSALRLAGTDERIPTFAEVLTLVDGRVPLLVELKGESLDVSLCRKVADLLETYSGAYCIESFNPLLLREMRKYLPNALCGLLYTNVVRDRQKASPINCSIALMVFNCLAHPNFIAYNEADRDALPVRLVCGLYRVPRFVWTVRTQDSLALARATGEHPIFEQLDPNRHTS